jgi:hypothetical protein
MNLPAMNLPAMHRGTLAVRVAIVLAGIAVIVLPGHPRPFIVIVTACGVAVAVTSPARAGAAVAIGGAIAGWLAAQGWHGSPSVLRTVSFALALYVLNSSTALAAAVPLSSRLHPRVALRWARRCLLVLAISAVFVTFNYSLDELAGSGVLIVAGLLGTIAVTAVPLLLLTGRGNAD